MRLFWPTIPIRKTAMKNAEATVGNLIDHQKVAFISSIDEQGYPNTKAMLPPRKREGIKVFYLSLIHI